MDWYRAVAIAAAASNAGAEGIDTTGLPAVAVAKLLTGAVVTGLLTTAASTFFSGGGGTATNPGEPPTFIPMACLLSFLLLHVRLVDDLEGAEVLVQLGRVLHVHRRDHAIRRIELFDRRGHHRLGQGLR